MKILRGVIVGLVAVVMTLIFLSFPTIEDYTRTCSESILCGQNIKSIVNFVSKSDVTALAFGSYLEQKFISGIIVFIVTLVLIIIAERARRR